VEAESKSIDLKKQIWVPEKTGSERRKEKTGKQTKAKPEKAYAESKNRWCNQKKKMGCI
jgi:hypothetical protein